MTILRAARPADAEAIARCHIAAWRDTYRPIVAEEYLNNLSLEDHVTKWIARLHQPDCPTFVAEIASGELVGFINGGRERTGRTDYRGEIFSIYILKGFRGQRIGRRLLRRFSAALLENGIASLIVWAFQDNECRHCYAAWGGQEIAVGPIKVGEQNLVEVAYGWQDIGPLAERASRRKRELRATKDDDASAPLLRR
jgi:ribosomal protein S18 acetylase RimI-like enzyme